MSQMPDKIWLHKDTKYNTGDVVCGYQYEFAQEIECEGIENFVEYVPKYAFIEKACEFLFENYHGEKLSLRMIENFRRYMKGE